jgi:hypothetical protein
MHALHAVINSQIVHTQLRREASEVRHVARPAPSIGWPQPVLLIFGQQVLTSLDMRTAIQLSIDVPLRMAACSAVQCSHHRNSPMHQKTTEMRCNRAPY